ncbi:hypothetical protein GF376_03340 [Candidatus Peregrinibacteria bacterium]|nr:hypothetical protein [Candidatus Peregrinibacteria bacterium]
MQKFEKIKIPTFSDDRGDLSVLEFRNFFNWTPERLYYVTGTKKARGGHCVKGEKKIYLMMQGSCSAKIYDGANWYEIELNGPDDALIFHDELWREFENFSENAVMAAICNAKYDKNLYITDLKDYQNYINNK